MKKLFCILMLLMLFVPFLVTAEEVSLQSETEELLSSLAESEKDPWAQAILDDGIRDFTSDGSSVTFYLRSYNPGLQDLDVYTKTGDQQLWLKTALENASAFDLEISLPLENGSLGKKAKSVLKTQVKKAAAAAKKAFDSKDMSSALADLFFCVPVEITKSTKAADLRNVSDAFSAFISAHPDIWPCKDPSEWAPLFCSQKKPVISVKNGPHDLLMTWTGYTARQLLADTYNSASAELAALPVEKRAAGDDLIAFWQEKLLDAGLSSVKKAGSKNSVHINITDLSEGRFPKDYLAFMKAFDSTQDFNRLAMGLASMPAEASLKMPKNGVITNNKKGRTVTVRVPKGGADAYVQFRDADTNVIMADAFVTPGNNIRVKVPEGTYYVLYAIGSTWYGTEKLFGPLGTYQTTNDFAIAKKPWKLVPGEEQEGITLSLTDIGKFAAVKDQSLHIKGQLESPVRLASSYPDNPVIEGISSTTGLPSSGEKYTPILMVLDNAEEAYPHWGVSDADIIFQVPNAGSGVTKLMALFADHYPEGAGPVRSGRASMVPMAKAFDAAFAYAGPPAIKSGNNVVLDNVMSGMNMYKEKKVYNLLRGGYTQKIFGVSGKGGHNKSVLVEKIHNQLLDDHVIFEERPFRFTDEKRTDGIAADIIKVLHHGEKATSASNSASRAVFRYDPETNSYTRTNSSGLYTDRNTEETVRFANVIVIRVKFDWEHNFVYLHKHLVGSGCADIFQCGRYVQGAWHRASTDSRLVLVGPDGSELQLQRGKTFIILTNEITDIIYSVK